jgi:hypothetical protein
VWHRDEHFVPIGCEVARSCAGRSLDAIDSLVVVWVFLFNHIDKALTADNVDASLCRVIEQVVGVRRYRRRSPSDRFLC